MEMEKLLLKPAEVGDLTGLGKSKTYALIAAGIIPSVRIGKSVRVPADRLRRWIEELHVNEQTPPRAEPTPSVAPLHVPGKRSLPVFPSGDGAQTVKKRSQNPQRSEEA
jgi:excisionase family DNA binding protein